jgi:hypothetical protein
MEGFFFLMATDSEILLAVNRILSPYKTQVVAAGPKVDKIRITSSQRSDDQSNISNQLKSQNIRFVNEIDKSESSFPVTKISLPKSNSVIKLIYKKSSGGGSGAGAAITQLAESAQALYAALAFNVLNRPMQITDVTKDNFSKAAATAFITASVQSVLNDLTDDWINSSISGANALYRKFSSKGKFTFHRGSSQVSSIESTFSSINKSEKAFGNLNKWSPADIYIISNNASMNRITNEKSLKSLNVTMMDLIKNNEIIGVSLKKITGGGSISQKNFSSDVKSITAGYRGMTTNLDAMDGYIQWGSSSSEKIQFRSFGGDTSLTGWQGEIKGASANQGKISLGPINFILKRHGLSEIPTSSQSASLASSNKIDHCQNIARMMVSNGIISSSQIDETAKTIQEKSNKYRYSKYLVLKLFETISSAPSSVKDDVVQDFYLYASSQAAYAAPYYKLE